jgi:hypothetical protein
VRKATDTSDGEYCNSYSYSKHARIFLYHITFGTGGLAMSGIY